MIDYETTAKHITTSVKFWYKFFQMMLLFKRSLLWYRPRNLLLIWAFEGCFLSLLNVFYLLQYCFLIAPFLVYIFQIAQPTLKPCSIEIVQLFTRTCTKCCLECGMFISYGAFKKNYLRVPKSYCLFKNLMFSEFIWTCHWLYIIIANGGKVYIYILYINTLLLYFQFCFILNIIWICHWFVWGFFQPGDVAKPFPIRKNKLGSDCFPGKMGMLHARISPRARENYFRSLIFPMEKKPQDQPFPDPLMHQR